MAKKRKFIIGGVVVLVAALVLGYIIYFMGVGIREYNVGELLSKEPPLTNQTVRVNGVLQPDPRKENLTWYFIIKDVNTEDVLSVVYTGTVPHTFQVEVPLVVEGQYDAVTGIFEGSRLTMKCSSKYEPAT
ncbi:MAG: cytochrome c maturation protein CcmE [Dehalococcoidia bacterium]|nr:cytochrome c maturation protein CcmE [Dehalococcoidia bacterium]